MLLQRLCDLGRSFHTAVVLRKRNINGNNVTS